MAFIAAEVVRIKDGAHGESAAFVHGCENRGDTDHVSAVVADGLHGGEHRVARGNRCGQDQNVLAVGRVLTKTLKEKGITALHCTVMHDDPTLSGSYDRADKTVEQYLLKMLELVKLLH